VQTSKLDKAIILINGLDIQIDNKLDHITAAFGERPFGGITASGRPL
jgi:hypothetical protein